ncbi:phospholipid-transporting ATPase ABCA3-like [Oppia nitens]|uniref:phospholipid-transporting ATPase ABCA3-like n=1 Tax=Oppia nitens TaxID=1686743 RepID=UPI0023DC6C06|nr:phospholipid-transporting ATPase ABCA3-like [Oppia nitens]
MQLIIDLAFISLVTNNSDLTQIEFFTQRMPLPSMTVFEKFENHYIYNDNHIVTAIILFNMTIMLSVIIKRTVEERQTRITDYLIQMGVGRHELWLSVIIDALIVISLQHIIVTLILMINNHEFVDEDSRQVVDNVLKDINLKINNKSITVILGPNGSGKTTLINVITGLVDYSGDITISGHDISREQHLVQNMTGICPQDNVYFKFLTIKDHLLLFSCLKRLIRNSDDGYTEKQLIQLLDLNKDFNKEAYQLSGGTLRRLVLAIAFIGPNDVLILDEPSAALDPRVTRKVWDLIIDSRKNKTILITTHHLNEANLLADQICIISKGMVCFNGSTLDMKKHFNSGYQLKICKSIELQTENQITQIIGKYTNIQKISKKGLIDTQEVIYELNFEDNHRFYEMFSELEEKKSILAISDIALDMTTLEGSYAKIVSTNNYQNFNNFETESNDDNNFILKNNEIINNKLSLQLKPLLYQLYILKKKLSKNNEEESVQELPLEDLTQSPDVRQEYEIVSQIIRNNDLNNVSLVVQNLNKMLNKTTIIPKSLSFVVNKGECFGLLGINGSGKTTTFRLLTGDLELDSGNAYLGSDANLLTNMRQFYSQIGYCPQNDALLDRMTGRQTLLFFGRLRGLSKHSLNIFIENISQKFSLQSIIDKRLSTYSGGNRRKLSLAIALIGSPRLLLLDEPTNGVDPDSRLNIWQILRHLINESNISILLSSHNMEECETLCSRLAILSNGVIKTIGSLPQLRKSFANGFDIILKVNCDSSDNINDELDSKMKQLFGEKCINKYSNCGVFYYHLIRDDIKLSQIFKSLQTLKQNFNLEDYMCANSGLQQAFLAITTFNTL